MRLRALFPLLASLCVALAGLIRSDGYVYEDEEADRQRIDEKLSSHDFVMHHSPAYNARYRFRYRIIARDLFLNELLPLIIVK